MSIVKWTNPTQYTDGTAYDAASLNAGYELSFDASVEAQVVLPFAFGSQFDMADLEAYKALKAGSHKVNLRVISKQGAKSDWASGTFLIIGTPKPVTDVSVV
jgi:hypothetical protein